MTEREKMPEADFDLVVVGGGVAGLTAAMYGGRSGLRTVVLERLMTGGQVVNADRIENFPGFPDGISGGDIGGLVLDQATKYGADVRLSEVIGLAQGDRGWAIQTYDGQLTARAVIVAGGSTLKTLDVPGEADLKGAGVSYCATCDGAFFAEEVVGVVGGGDSAMDEALVLAEIASRVIVFHRGERLEAQRLLQDRVLSHPKVEIRPNAEVTAILGDGMVQAVSVRDETTGEPSRVDLSGVFVYVGLEPNSGVIESLLTVDGGGHVPTDIWMRTELPGLLAAGDIRQGSSSQLVSAAGDGATAAIAAYRYIQSGEWRS